MVASPRKHSWLLAAWSELFDFEKARPEQGSSGGAYRGAHPLPPHRQQKKTRAVVC